MVTTENKVNTGYIILVAYGSKAKNSQNKKKYTEKSSSEKKIETVD